MTVYMMRKIFTRARVWLCWMGMDGLRFCDLLLGFLDGCGTSEGSFWAVEVDFLYLVL